MPLPESEQFHPLTGCRTDQLFGIWLMEFTILQSLVAEAKAVDLKWLTEYNLAENARQKEAATPPPPYELHAGGVAELTVKGTLTKYPTSFSSLFGGTSYVKVEENLRKALAADDVKAVLMTYESPGGSPNGLWDLGASITKAANKKPLMSRIQDTGCSAAYLLPACGGRISANSNANIGSIGVFSQLIDESGRLEKEGIKVVPILSGKFKGLGMTPAVSDTQIKEAQRRSDELWTLFANTVADHRRLTPEFVKGLEARVFLGEGARRMGLVDSIESHEETVDRLRSAASTKVTSVPVVSRDGTDPGQTQLPVAAQGDPMPKDLLAKLREIHNNPTLSEDEAEGLIVSTHQRAATVGELQTKINQLTANQKAEPIAPALLDGFKKVAKGEVTLATKGGTITDAQAAQLNEMIDKNGAVVAMPNDQGSSMISQFLSTASIAPKGIKEGEKTGTQPAALKTVDPNPQTADEYSMLDDAEKSVTGQYNKQFERTAAKG